MRMSVKQGLVACCIVLGNSIVLAEPQAGSIWIEPITGMALVYVPSGCFEMGSTGGEAYEEQPVHKVCIKGFYLGKYEVTQGQYKKVMGVNPSRFKGTERPVESVSRADVFEFILRLMDKNDQMLRLPTEAEWEYACRAGGAHSSFCGDAQLNELGWYGGNSYEQTHPVGRKYPNAWGLYDMSGNVMEWTQDCFHESYKGAPSDGRKWAKDYCKDVVVRGGGWYFSSNHERAATRTTVPYDSSGFSGLGFRIAMTLSSER